MPAASIRRHMTPRRPALAASTPLLVLGLAVAMAACSTTGPSPSPTTGPTAAATVAASPTSAPSAPAVSPTPTPVSGTGACDPARLAATITAWNGAAGHRIAMVSLTNNGKSTCTIHSLATPQLVDANGTILMQGTAPTSAATISLAYYDVVKTMVDAANYCGAAPTGPVSVAFLLPGGEGRVVAAPATGDPLQGVPPCLGPAGSPGDLQMQPFAP